LWWKGKKTGHQKNESRAKKGEQAENDAFLSRRGCPGHARKRDKEVLKSDKSIFPSRNSGEEKELTGGRGRLAVKGSGEKTGGVRNRI